MFAITGFLALGILCGLVDVNRPVVVVFVVGVGWEVAASAEGGGEGEGGLAVVLKFKLLSKISQDSSRIVSIKSPDISLDTLVSFLSVSWTSSEFPSPVPSKLSSSPLSSFQYWVCWTGRLL